MTPLEMNHSSEELDSKPQHSWQNRTRNFQHWTNTSTSNLERNLSSEEMSMGGRSEESTRATAYGHEDQARYLRNGTYEEETFSEVFSRPPDNVSAYQHDGWTNDTFPVGNMNLSVRHYLEQVTRFPEWFENNTMNKWEDKTRQSDVTKGHFSNDSTSQMWNMNFQDVTRYLEATSNTSMGSIEINTTGQIQTTVSNHTMTPKMNSNNSYTSNVDIWNVTASTSMYGIPEVTARQTESESTHSSVTSRAMKDILYDGRLGMNESITILGMNESITNRVGMNENITSRGMNESITNRVGMNESITSPGMNESITSRGMNESITNQGMNESITSRWMNESITSQGMNESITSQGMNESITNRAGMNESITNRVGMNESITSQGMNESITNRAGMNESITNRVGMNESITSQGMNESITNRWMNESITNRGMNENITNRVENWNLTGSSPSTTSASFDVRSPDNSESTINDTSVHRNRTRSCQIENNLTKDCLVAELGEYKQMEVRLMEIVSEAWLELSRLCVKCMILFNTVKFSS